MPRGAAEAVKSFREGWWSPSKPNGRSGAGHRTRSFRATDGQAIVRRHFKDHDVLRHTYISMLVGAFRSVGDTALHAGNSEAIIRKHYLDLKSTEEADRFWTITPSGTALPGNMEEKDGRYFFPAAPPKETAK